jgi:hypothetical protein
MVRQVYEIAEGPGPEGMRRRRPGAAAAATEPTIAGIRTSVLLVLFMVSLFIPGILQIAGLRLSPSTIFMLVMIVPAFYRVVTDPENRITVVDVFITTYVLWCGLAIFYHYGPSRAVFIVNQTVTMLGGYIITRAFVRTAEDYRLFFKCFLFGLLFYLPFALIEMATKRMLVSEILGKVLQVDGRAGQGPRMGLWRVQAFLPHSILFGLFCSIGVSNMFYMYLGSPLRQATRTGIVAFMTALSLSSAPTIAMGLQFMLIGWDRLSRFIPGRWIVLVVSAGFLLTVLHLSSENGILGLMIENLAYDETTGWGRTEILQYSSAEVARHPVFGIGLEDWVRPYWRKPSVDNFWLLTAMRFGLPSLLLLWLGIGVHNANLMAIRDLDAEEKRYRTGHVIAWTGVFFILWTVHIWDAAAVFIMAYAGAGAWLYTRRAPRPEEGRQRPREMGRERRGREGRGREGQHPDGAPALPYARSHAGSGQAGRRPAGDTQDGRRPAGDTQDSRRPAGDTQDGRRPAGSGQDGRRFPGSGQDGRRNAPPALGYTRENIRSDRVK